VFSFVAAIDHLTFVEAVQRLADRAGITLTMVDGGGPGRGEVGNRSRLLAANKAAAAFYAGQLTTDEAAPAREFLAQRGFDLAAAAHFGCGFAPAGWDRLIKALTSQGFSVRELTEAGLARSGQRGPIDQFHRRLLWPIRDGAGDVVGFGARRLFDDDRLEAKYINTSDTRVYHKSQVLFGLDLAKREIAKQRRAVVVEGYTDVMAMHLAGVTTAVASCGTAFGDEHVSVLRRYLQDNEVMRGEVIYTFDGDAAGQKAALKAFDADQRFAANTSVAIAPDGMDPCELRLESGDVALRELVEGRKPLFAFAIRSTLDGYDLDTAEGQVAATTAAIPLVARIKEVTLREEYARRLAGWLGVEPGPIVGRVRQSATAFQKQDQRRAGSPGLPDRGRGDRADAGPPDRTAPDRSTPGRDGPDRDAPEPGGGAPGPARPDPADRRSSVEREMVKLVLQQPDLVASGYAQVQAVAFTDPAYLAVHEAVLRAGGPEETGGGAGWVTAVAEQAPAGAVRSLVTELAVEPPSHRSDEPDGRYAGAIVARMAERTAAIEERRLQSALRRAEAEHDRDRAMSLQTDLVKMAAYRRALSDRARGEMV